MPVEHDLGDWTKRRLFMVATVLFCMGCIVYVMINDRKGGVSEMIVVSAFTTIATTMGSYVFGATWEHVSAIRSHREPRSRFGRFDDPDGEL
jgi:Na+/melibiose symporter-like transporter